MFYTVRAKKKKKKKIELGRPYWGTQSPAGRWREKTDVTEKK